MTMGGAQVKEEGDRMSMKLGAPATFNKPLA